MIQSSHDISKWIVTSFFLHSLLYYFCLSLSLLFISICGHWSFKKATQTKSTLESDIILALNVKLQIQSEQTQESLGSYFSCLDLDSTEDTETRLQNISNMAHLWKDQHAHSLGEVLWPWRHNFTRGRLLVIYNSYMKSLPRLCKSSTNWLNDVDMLRVR